MCNTSRRAILSSVQYLLACRRALRLLRQVASSGCIGPYAFSTMESARVPSSSASSGLPVNEKNAKQQTNQSIEQSTNNQNHLNIIKQAQRKTKEAQIERANKKPSKATEQSKQPSKTKQSTKQSKTTKRSKAKQSEAKRSKAKQSKTTKRSKSKQSRAQGSKSKQPVIKAWQNKTKKRNPAKAFYVPPCPKM